MENYQKFQAVDRYTGKVDNFSKISHAQLFIFYYEFRQFYQLKFDDLDTIQMSPSSV